MKYKVETDLLKGYNKGDTVRAVDMNGRGFPCLKSDIKGINEDIIERNPDWFQPIEQVKEGEYRETSEGYIYRVQDVKDGKVLISLLHNEDEYHISKEILLKERKLSTHEIKEVLTNECQNRGLLRGGAMVRPLDNEHREIHWFSDCTKFEYNSSEDIMLVHNRIIYEKGVFAELIKKQPNIEINGYEAEFCDGYIKFGCAEINRGLIEDLYRTIKTHHKNIEALGYDYKKVQEVKIGDGTFTVEDLKKIVEHYE